MGLFLIQASAGSVPTATKPSRSNIPGRRQDKQGGHGKGGVEWKVGEKQQDSMSPPCPRVSQGSAAGRYGDPTPSTPETEDSVPVADVARQQGQLLSRILVK